jgi:hypothetical protein
MPEPRRQSATILTPDFTPKQNSSTGDFVLVEVVQL